MSVLVCRQPNGKICRFSTVVDTITDYNLTDDEYIEMEAESARECAKRTLAEGLANYDDMIGRFEPTNMSRAEFYKIRCLMGEK